MILRILFLNLFFVAGACTHSVHNYHISDSRVHIPKHKPQTVESSAEQFVILGFVTQTDYVDQAFSDLKATCPGGRISQIHTRYSTSHGFLSWTNKVKMKGLCVRKPS